MPNFSLMGISSMWNANSPRLQSSLRFATSGAQRCSPVVSSTTLFASLWSPDSAVNGSPYRYVNSVTFFQPPLSCTGGTWIIKSGVTTTPMKQCPSWEADSDIPLMLWKPEVDYNIHNAPALIPVLSQINPNTRTFAAWRRKTPSKTLYKVDQVPNVMA